MTGIGGREMSEGISPGLMLLPSRLNSGGGLLTFSGPRKSRGWDRPSDPLLLMEKSYLISYH